MPFQRILWLTPVCLRGLGLWASIFLLWPAAGWSLDFSQDILVYREDFEGEVAFPATPEMDTLSIGGLLGATNTDLLGPPPALSGSAVVEAISDATTIAAAVYALNPPLGTGSFALRAEHAGLSSPVDRQIVVSLITDFPYQGGTGFPAIGLWLVVNRSSSSPELVASILLIETDGDGVAIDNYLEVSLSNAEATALIAGTSFVLDFRADRAGGTLAGSIDISGFPTRSVGPLALGGYVDSGDAPFVLLQGIDIRGGSAPPGDVTQVDLEALEVYQGQIGPAVPALGSIGTGLLVMGLASIGWVGLRMRSDG